ncbi:MAG: hypothetical protein AUI04_09705 [Candidatus Rokubacteria bacterium 13_2_20CM_2_64_8]|nr:MAG: hypothetical protein AUI04_09705 [Candidatus Rokubacteria bacterium 13_2_20CM_2_64_8]
MSPLAPALMEGATAPVVPGVRARVKEVTVAVEEVEEAAAEGVGAARARPPAIAAAARSAALLMTARMMTGRRRRGLARTGTRR